MSTKYEIKIFIMPPLHKVKDMVALYFNLFCLYTETTVQGCVSGAQEKIVPLVKDVAETVQKVVDLGTTAAEVATTCAPSGVSWITALACYVAKIVSVSGDVAADISIITRDVPEIIKLAPEAKQEVEACTANVKTATSDVEQLLGAIKTCVDNYTTSAA
jgi:hypothetical protein